jgi:hypothetical protein
VTGIEHPCKSAFSSAEVGTGVRSDVELRGGAVPHGNCGRGPPLENALQETVDKGDDALRHAQDKNAADDEGSKGKREILELGPKRLK